MASTRTIFGILRTIDSARMPAINTQMPLSQKFQDLAGYYLASCAVAAARFDADEHSVSVVQRASACSVSAGSVVGERRTSHDVDPCPVQ